MRAYVFCSSCSFWVQQVAVIWNGSDHCMAHFSQVLSGKIEDQSEIVKCQLDG